MIMKQVARDYHQEEDSYGEIFRTILLVVTPFILSTGIYNVNNFLDKTIYQKLMMTVMDLKESIVATDLSAIAKGTKISNIPIALASAMATALIPGISSDFVKETGRASGKGGEVREGDDAGLDSGGGGDRRAGKAHYAGDLQSAGIS